VIVPAELACDLPVAQSMPPLGLRDAIVEAPEFPRVRIVRDEATMRRIGELRHRQYVERLGRHYPSIAGGDGCLIEEIDGHSVNIYAEDAAGITCAMRINDLVDERHRLIGFFREVADRFGIPRDSTLTCSRLVRAPGHSGRHAVHLIQFVRLQTVRAGWRYCVMQTAERLVPFFRRFEFFETGMWSDDPVAGPLQTLILDTRSIAVQPKA
jgi:hypothetical protein